jgi:hypothetical protein
VRRSLGNRQPEGAPSRPSIHGHVDATHRPKLDKPTALVVVEAVVTAPDTTDPEVFQKLEEIVSWSLRHEHPSSVSARTAMNERELAVRLFAFAFNHRSHFLLASSVL